MQREDGDDEGFRVAKVKDADDKHDFKPVGADARETLQDNPGALHAVCHQVHTPQQEQKTPSKLESRKSAKEMRHESHSLDQASLRTSRMTIIVVMQHHSLCLIMDQHEVCVETVCLNQPPLEDTNTTDIRSVQRADGESAHRLIKK